MNAVSLAVCAVPDPPSNRSEREIRSASISQMSEDWSNCFKFFASQRGLEVNTQKFWHDFKHTNVDNTANVDNTDVATYFISQPSNYGRVANEVMRMIYDVQSTIVVVVSLLPWTEDVTKLLVVDSYPIKTSVRSSVRRKGRLFFDTYNDRIVLHIERLVDRLQSEKNLP